mmetsp:Transcript_25983/g.66016  ORF Transcript_25983/g.66016 Transcript_25983/m.66016 type:complete len:80 (-) Transcript_25983:50-289(-)
MELAYWVIQAMKAEEMAAWTAAEVSSALAMAKAVTEVGNAVAQVKVVAVMAGEKVVDEVEAPAGVPHVLAVPRKKSRAS